MLKIICKEGHFLAKGTFSIGIAGTFENKDFGEGNIEFTLSLRDLTDRNTDLPWIAPLQSVLSNVPTDEHSLAVALENYYNALEAKIQKNSKQLNDYFLFRLIEMFEDCGYPFWETAEAIHEEYRDTYTEEYFDTFYDNPKRTQLVSTLYQEYDEMPNDGTLAKTDVARFIAEQYPMFNLDGLIASITPEFLTLNGAEFSVQFSDGWDNEFYCGAYDQFDDALTPQDWHNF